LKLTLCLWFRSDSSIGFKKICTRYFLQKLSRANLKRRADLALVSKTEVVKENIGG